MRLETFKMIEDSSPLSEFLNGIMRRLQKIRLICAPVSFQREDSISSFQDEKFCDFCRYEAWMHGVVSRLNEWRSVIDEYFTEFNGSWKYYAASKMMEAGFTASKDEDYRHFSVIESIYTDGWKDIVQDTRPSDLKELCSDLIADSHIDYLQGIRRHFGDNVQAFKMKDGSMRPISQEEHELDMALGQANAEDDVKRILGIAGGLWGIFIIIKSLKTDEDNIGELQDISTMTQALLNLDFDTLHDIFRKYNGEYTEQMGCGGF